MDLHHSARRILMMWKTDLSHTENVEILYTIWKEDKTTREETRELKCIESACKIAEILKPHESLFNTYLEYLSKHVQLAFLLL